ncbi:MAG: VOC family protein [Pseudomonadota bacterium]
MGRGRGIDHVGIATHNLDGLAAEYEALGFTLTPRAYHQDHMGTSNRLVQFEGRNFIELLEVDRPETMLPHGPDFMGFGQFNHDFLAKREGMSLIIFQTEDTAADLARWKAKGLDVYDQFNFERQATLPDGSQATVRFELGFVTSPAIPDVLFYVCDNKAEEHFWKPEYQSHANGAHGMISLTLCVDDPAAGADFLGALFDGLTNETPEGYGVRCGGGGIELRRPEQCKDYGWDTPPLGAIGMGIDCAARRGTTTHPADAGNVFIRWV